VAPTGGKWNSSSPVVSHRRYPSVIARAGRRAGRSLFISDEVGAIAAAAARALGTPASTREPSTAPRRAGPVQHRLVFMVGAIRQFV